MAATAPTKGNLMAAKRSRELAENGWQLMDKKRNILIRELMERIDRVSVLQEQVEAAFRAAYETLALAEIEMGPCEAAAATVPEDDSVRILWRSVMGVEIPTVRADETGADVLPYALAGTCSVLDEAYRRFVAVKSLLAELAETENAVYRLAFFIKKSQKRANALENIVLPGLDGDIRRISEALAEKEREEFVRQKVIKADKARKNA